MPCEFTRKRNPLGADKSDAMQVFVRLVEKGSFSADVHPGILPVKEQVNGLHLFG